MKSLIIKIFLIIGFFITSLFPAQIVLAGGCVVPPSNMVSWWPGDEHAVDIVDSNDGAFDANTFDLGKVQQAFKFDGINDAVSIPFNNNFDFSPDSAFTIDAWVKLSELVGTKALVIKGASFVWDWGLWHSGNKLLTGHHNHNLIGTQNLGANQWHHVAVTYNDGDYKLYVDGVLDPASVGWNFDCSVDTECITQSGNDLTFGARVSNRYFKGLIDEVEIFNRALSQPELQTIYNAGSNGKCKIEVSIDIKPGSDPNCFNVNGHGVVPVAVLGSPEFDVTDINLGSLWFSGWEVRMRGKKGPLCSIEDVNGDGYDDLVCHFEDDAEAWDQGNASATLTGTLGDGNSFGGSDSICIVPM